MDQKWFQFPVNLKGPQGQRALAGDPDRKMKGESCPQEPGRAAVTSAPRPAPKQPSRGARGGGGTQLQREGSGEGARALLHTLLSGGHLQLGVPTLLGTMESRDTRGQDPRAGWVFREDPRTRSHPQRQC